MEAWKKRKAEIEAELAEVWVQGEGVLKTPEFVEDSENAQGQEGSSTKPEEVDVLKEGDGEEVALSDEAETERAASEAGYNTDNTQDLFVTPAATPMERGSP